MGTELFAAVEEEGGHFLAHQSVQLGGTLAIMGTCMVTAATPEEFRQRLAGRLAGWKIRCSRGGLPENMVKPTKIIELNVKSLGQSHPDEELRSVLAMLDYEAAAMECGRVPVIGLGQSAFTARCTLKVPAHCSTRAIADDIEAMMPGALATVV